MSVQISGDCFPFLFSYCTKPCVIILLRVCLYLSYIFIQVVLSYFIFPFVLSKVYLYLSDIYISVVELIIFAPCGPREAVLDKANSKQRNSKRLKIVFSYFHIKRFLYFHIWTRLKTVFSNINGLKIVVFIWLFTIVRYQMFP